MSARVGTGQPVDLLAWSRAYRLEAGGPLEFDRFPFQREIYQAFGDPCLRSVEVMKASQCGISAAGVSLALYAADVWGANVLYVLPGFEDAHDFSDTRVRTAIRRSAHLRSRARSTNNKGLKQIGEGFVYFRGSGSEQQALSIPADVLVLDEFDHLDQRQVPMLRRRLSAPTSMRLERAFSNPSFPEDGIHGQWLGSDQRRWLVSCRRCRYEAPVSWEAGEDHFVDEERLALVCGRCRARLSAAAVASGRWVAEHPGADRPGYHISKLIVPGEDLGELVTSHRRTDEDSVRVHYNCDLGLPYAPRGGSLSRDLVLACRTDLPTPDRYDGPGWVSAGVDVGKVLHVRISVGTEQGKVLPLYLGTVEDFEELARLWRRFGVNFGLVDERPEERKAKEFAQRFAGRCRLIRWSPEEQPEELVLKGHDLVIARRTASCDRLVAEIESQRRLVPRDPPTDYVPQMTAPHRVTARTERGQKVARYVSERTDHYFFAEVYDLLAREARRPAAAGIWGPPPQPLREQIRRRRGRVR